MMSTRRCLLSLGQMENNVSSEVIVACKEIQLFIIDDISFANVKTLKDAHSLVDSVNETLGQFPKFGGIDTVFYGDSPQLEPVRVKVSSYPDDDKDFDDCINCHKHVRIYRRNCNFRTEQRGIVNQTWWNRRQGSSDTRSNSNNQTQTKILAYTINVASEWNPVRRMRCRRSVNCTACHHR